MKRFLIATFSIVLGFFFFFSLSSGTIGQDGKDPEFQQLWEKVDSLERKGLFREALSEVGNIFQFATTNSNHNQVIKSVLFELKYNAYLEEDDYVLGIARLDELIQKAPSPSKEILHSLSAEVYWGYYSSNRWKFQNRTNVSEVDLKDIRTWDLKRIAQKVRYHYLQSLMHKDISQGLKINDFSEIASNTDQSNELRPTVFDFLAHRALDFFQTNTFGVPGPAETFAIEDANYFSSATTFLSIRPTTTDSLNTRFFAVKLLQELTRFHKDAGNTIALFGVELDRLRFLRTNAFHPEKEDLYYTALQRLTTNYKSIDYVSEAWYEIASFHSIRGNQYRFPNDTTYRWEKKVAMRICEKTIEQYPDAFGGRQCAVLKANLLSKELNITGEKAIASEQRSKFQVGYKNIDSCYYKIIPYDYKKANRGYDNWDKFVKHLRETKGLFKKEIRLENPGDFQSHTTEVEIPALKNGFYYVIVGSEPDFSGNQSTFSYMPLWVSDITFQHRRTNNDHQVLVSDRTSGEALVNASVKVSYEKYNYRLRKNELKSVGNYKTDAKGRISFQATEDYYNYRFDISDKGEIYVPDEGVYSYYYDNYEVNAYETHFFTDRTLYRPGQTIFFKGIMVHKEGKKRSLVKNQTTTVILYDVNSQEIARQEVKTNKFGSYQGEFNAPFGVLTGQMRIQDSYGSSYFRVEEYKRPKFDVKMNPQEGEYKVNDRVTSVGVAKAFAGNFIDGADVQYRITRSTSYSWGRYWSYWRPVESPKEIDHGTTTTDENGEFKIEFNALADKKSDPKDLPIFTYTITADVTDINGETHSTTQSIIVGYQSLKLGQNLEGEMNNEDDYTLVVKTTNLNGQKIAAKGNIRISKLKTPDHPYYTRFWDQPDMQRWSEEQYRSKFPLDEYTSENEYHLWGIEKEVFRTGFDTKASDSIPIPKYGSWKPGVYFYEATAKDKNGIEVKDSYYFTVFNPAAQTIPGNDALWTKVLKSTLEPGENIELLIGTADENLHLSYEIEANNQLEKPQVLKLSKEQRKITIPVTEAYRGNVTIHFSAVRNNRTFTQSATIFVPYTNKQLDLEFATFRNKLLPGAEEEWTLTIKNKKGEKEQAELLASLYDASLDQLYTPNSYYLSVYETYYGRSQWGAAYGAATATGNNIDNYWNDYVSYPYRYFPSLNYHGWSSYYYPGRFNYRSLEAVTGGVSANYGDIGNKKNKESKSIAFTEAPMGMDDDLAEEKDDEEVADMDGYFQGGKDQTATGTLSKNGNQQQLSGEGKGSGAGAGIETNGLQDVKARTNFNETAFFYPQLLSDTEGNVKIKFTIPESLTKWTFLGLAHTEDLKVGTISEEVVTQKDLMVVPNAPRFLREGDQITIQSKVSNLSEGSLQGKIQLSLIDPFTEEVIDSKFALQNVVLDFQVESGKSTVVSWSIDVPYELSAVKYKVIAKAGDFSDGEENVLPILSNRMLVTESLPLPIRGNENKSFSFTKLKNSGQSSTLRHHRYTLEFTSNPAWYAIQAMPYMMEYPYECAEQTFTRYYSNAIASHIMNSNPKIKAVIEKWGKESPEAFLSNLQKNQELKSVILEETPWVLDAKSEEQSKKNLSVLLDMNRMSRELDKALSKVIKAQSINGGWPWFPGMKESRYITQHIITGMGHLDHLGIKDVRENGKVWRTVKKGIDYLDGQIVRDYELAKKWDPNYLTTQHIGYTQIQYLYARSYFPKIGMNKKTMEAVAYYKSQAEKFWLNFNIYAEGMIALAAHRLQETDLANDIVKSLKDRSIQTEEFGMYWKDYYVGYYWYEAPIETQALMIELFDEVANDQEAVEELKIWLLKEKQTTNWKTTKQTSEAVYALLLKGTDLLASDDLVQITIGGKPIEYKEEPNSENPYEVKSQAGTGYFKTHWNKEKVKPEMGDITVSKASKGVAWGAAYWQYFEDLDKITFAKTNLQLKKDLFLVKVTNQGEQLVPVNDNNTVHIGDKLRVRIELRTDRNLEYVHMKDMRASGFEPINVLSSYRYQDGLGYYQATKDAATNFFFDYIKKGTYVFEYDLRVQHKGDFSNGVTTIQCMYAPEFTSHSDGIRVNVE